MHTHPDLEVLWKIKESSIDLNKTCSQMDVDINWNSHVGPNSHGNLENVSKLPQKINSNIIFVDSSMLFINTRKKISIIN